MVDFSQLSAKQFKIIVHYSSTLIKMGVPQYPNVVEGLRVEWDRREKIKKAKFSEGRQKVRTEQREQRIGRRT